ncbi:MAG: TonB-dependent receptor [Lentimicrobiaceae bacterium]|nr:TonB-dependent receptor [Lentimicrobiaceae bacterium]
MKKTILTLLTSFSFLLVAAQTNNIRGVVKDMQTGETLPNVSITTNRQSVYAITDENGNFEMENVKFPIELTFNYLSHERKMLVISKPTSETLEIFLKQEDVYLKEISVFADVARERHNPVALTTIRSDVITTQLGDNPFPLLLNRTPGTYSSRDGGGSGDATLTIRGFKQENITVLLNGVPINGAESGSMYWNNWIGLTDATANIQLQRGIGASKVAMNSVGGTVNIITYQANQDPGGFLSVSTTSYGNQKYTLSYRTGELPNGWNVSFLGSRNVGTGYVDATYVDGWSYFLNVSKNINARQRFVFSVMGGPERHGQRNLKLTQDEIDKYGIKYNKDWGSYNGKTNNTSENFYHKPHFALNHYWNIDEKTMLSTSAYFSPGIGGGKWKDNMKGAKGIFDFVNPSGQVDWDAIYAYNANNEDFYELADGSVVNGYSKIVQTNMIANHTWGGLLSSIEKSLAVNTKLIAGVHYRYFKSSSKQELTDLLGGEFYIDDFSTSLAGVSGRDQIKKVGDIIRRNNGALLHQGSVFVQLEQKVGRFNFFLGGTLSDNFYRRYDNYNYPDNKWSEWVDVLAYDAKGGVNFNIDSYQNVYLNGGWFNKAPQYKFVFGNSSNDPVKDTEGEKVKTIELGYNLRYKKNYLLANVYYTSWEDVSLLSDKNIQLENDQKTRAMITGLNALHKGVEVEIGSVLTNWFHLGATLSIGNWKWKNDVEATLLDNNYIPIDTVHIFADGLKVGGAPQFQTGIFTKFQILKKINLELNMTYMDKHYADFEPASRNNPNDKSQSYRLPSAVVFDAHLSFNHPIGKQTLTVYANCNNLFDHIYILKGTDGATHDLTSFTGFWSFGRTLDVGLRLSF